MKIKAIIHPTEEGGYWAEVLALPGCITEKDSMERSSIIFRMLYKGGLEVANESQKPDRFSSVIEIAV